MGAFFGTIKLCKSVYLSVRPEQTTGRQTDKRGPVRHDTRAEMQYTLMKTEEEKCPEQNSLWTVLGMQFLDFFDFLTNSVMMPIAAIATCLLVSRVVGVERIEHEVTLEGGSFRRKKVFNFMIRWLCPIFAAIILASSVANAFGWIAM